MTKHLKPTSASRRNAKLRYYDLKKNWRKVKPHLSDPLLNYILVHEVNKFTRERWGKPFTHGKYPADFDCQWWRNRHKGRTIPFHPVHELCLGWRVPLAGQLHPEVGDVG